jgi:hypothetical protein
LLQLFLLEFFLTGDELFASIRSDITTFWSRGITVACCSSGPTGCFRRTTAFRRSQLVSLVARFKSLTLLSPEIRSASVCQRSPVPSLNWGALSCSPDRGRMKG